MSTPLTSNTDSDLEEYATLLESTNRYKILRELPSLNFQLQVTNQDDKIAVILDTETTGLDPTRDEIIELAGISVSYSIEGKINSFISSFSQLQQPENPLSTEISDITGISNKMLIEKSINRDELESFIGTADLIIAHNAAFGRPFCEKLSDIFRRKPWACSATEIPWKTLGFDGSKLSYLVTNSGWFHKAHRAYDDCHALACVLNLKLEGKAYKTPFEYLLNSARETKVRISVSAPSIHRGKLKSKDFRWRPATGNIPGKWYVDLHEKDADSMIDWLVHHLKIKIEAISYVKLTAFNRYR